MEFFRFDFDIDQYLNNIIPRSRIYLLPNPVSRFLGYRSSPPVRIGAVLILFWSFIGAVLGILLVEAVYRTAPFQNDGVPIVFASLGATAILEYNAIDSPLAQPRNAILGQTFSAIIGVSITLLFQLSANFENLRWVAGALSVGTASVVMGITKTVHPPAGATALLAATSPQVTALGWLLLPLIMLGTVLMLVVGCLLNNIQRQFPMYWWTPVDLNPKTKADVERRVEEREAYDDLILGTEAARITIEDHRIAIPSWVSLEPEERSMLEVFQLKLKEGFGMINSNATNDTRVGDI